MVIYEFWKSVVLECQIYEKIFLVENISVAVYNIKSYLAFSKCLFPFPCPQKTLGIIILYGDDMDQMYLFWEVGRLLTLAHLIQTLGLSLLNVTKVSF